MKAKLLFGCALYSAAVFAQAPDKAVSVDEISRYKYGQMAAGAEKPAATVTLPQPDKSAVPASQKSAAQTWFGLTSSMNVFGVLLPESRQVSYNEDLDAITFIARRGPGYIASPEYSTIVGAHSGAIVAFVSTDGGSTWDSTLVWNHDVNWARYPQGGIWNPPGIPAKTVLSDAYVVVTGPITPDAGGWTGNYLASKSLSVFTNTADPQPGGQLYVPSTTTSAAFPTPHRFEMARQGFQATDDGKVRAAAGIYNSFGAAAGVSLFRGIRILTGQFSSGIFVWSHDSVVLSPAIVPSSLTPGGSNNYFQTYAASYNMAWNEAGTVGYAWMISKRLNTTDKNMGPQPMVWKTVNGGPWTLLPEINFNDTAKFWPLLKTIKFAWDTNTTNTNVIETGRRIPNFGVAANENIGATVDKNDNLHLTTIVGSSKYYGEKYMIASHEFTNVLGDQQIYQYAHTGDTIPLIVDFSTNSSGTWDMTVVDTLLSEGPSISPSDPAGYGYQYNPWIVDDNLKQTCNARFQNARTPDGEYIFYTWADTDPLTAGEFRRWNIAPDVYVRMRHVDSTKVHPVKINMTGSPTSPEVWTKAYMHHTSDKAKLLSPPTPYKVEVMLPVKVTKGQVESAGMRQDIPATHYFSASPAIQFLIDGIHDEVISANTSIIFPNPAKNATTLQIDMQRDNEVAVSLINLVGQEIKTQSFKGYPGKNEFNIDASNLSGGIYLVNIRVGGAQATKKLVIE